MRKNIVAGNWKMNKTVQEGESLASEITHMAEDELQGDVQLILAPPYVHLTKVQSLIKGNKRLALAAQNCSEHASGAFTGEISATMVKSCGASHVILGHSERREYFHETNALLKEKVDIALENNLDVIFCCGESLEIRESGQHEEFVTEQLTESLFHLSAEQMKHVVIAYEPIWAIGTGKTASSAQAQEMHKSIREHVAKHYDATVADDLSILYGGSCKPGNAKELFAQADVDGGLIGGASLKSRDFIDIAKSF